jgi:hypothetical protein
VFELASALTEKGYSTKVSFGIARDAGWPEALGIFIGTSAGGGLIGAVVADSYNTAKKWARRMFKQRSESEPKCEVSAQKLTIYDSEGKPIITWEISYRGELETDYRKPDPDLSCSGLVTTPAEVVEEGSGLGGDAGLGGHLLGADGDRG